MHIIRLRSGGPEKACGGGASLRVVATLVCLPLLLGACASLAPFSEKAYEQATSLKVESLALMDKAVEPFEGHRAEAEALFLKVEIAYEFAKGRPRNEISARQWEILKDPGRNLLGGFFTRWREKSTLPAAFVVEANGLVSDAYDTIIGTALKAFAV